MTRTKKRPRNFNTLKDEDEQNFFIRLFKNQRFLAFIGLMLLVLITFPFLKTYSKKRLIEEEMAQIKAEIARYEQETANLQEMIEYLGSEQSLEAQARLNLNLKKPGETVVVVEREKINNQKEAEQLEWENKSNLQKWKDYFFPANL